MKKWIVMFSVLVMLSGCSIFEKKTETEKPKEPVIEEPAPQPETLEADGVIQDVTSTRITIKTAEEELNLDRETMEATGSLTYGNEVHVTYEKIKEDLIAKTLKVTKEVEDEIAKLMDTMSIEELVGQMFMVRCPVEGALGAIDDYHMGGYILFDDAIYPYTADQFIANNQAFQNESKIPMLIGVDEEGGTVNRLSWYIDYRSEPFASPQSLYASGGFDLITSDTAEKDALLKSVGVNVNFAPVSDVSVDPYDFIYDRAFGKDALQTSEFVKTVVTQTKKDQMGSVLKHFPGYGNNVDTHTGSSLDERSYDSFVNNDFLPFEAGIKAGAGSVLVSHNVVVSMDEDYPASLSAKVHEILRKELKFDGVIFTDDLYMEAIRDQYGVGDAAVLAVKAGNDMLISSNYDTQINAVIQAVKGGEISEDRIRESVRRILTWKKELGLM